MKTVVIIGDSWGVPNYEGPRCGAEPHEHTEYRLRELGYRVYNCALNGGSNIMSTQHAIDYLSGKMVTLEPKSLVNNFHKQNSPTIIDEVYPKVDFVVWFHTESLRNFYNDQMTINENLYEGYKQDYEFVQKFVNSLNCKLIVIGGQAPIYSPLFYNYFNPFSVIEDWRSDIVGFKLPTVYWLTRTEWVDKSLDDRETKLDYLNKASKCFDAMRDSPNFIDNCHPAGIPHSNLSNLLHKIFQNTGEVAQTVRAMDS